MLVIEWSENIEGALHRRRDHAERSSGSTTTPRATHHRGGTVLKILAIDTSSQSASCAVTEEGKLLGEFFTNVRLTHSQTILPMVRKPAGAARVALPEIGRSVAVTDGPGSFTGLRIGLSRRQGDGPRARLNGCVGVSTLRGARVEPVGDGRRSLRRARRAAAPRSTPRSSASGGRLPRAAVPTTRPSPLSALEERLKKFGERVSLGWRRRGNVL